MITVIIQLTGVVVFVVGTVVLGQWIRRRPTPEVARASSRISHLLFQAGLFWPVLGGIAYPGLTRFDPLLGLHSPPRSPVGVVLTITGLCLAVASNKDLWSWGRGAAGFVLPKQIARGGIYRRVRNPMSLGWYLTCLGLGLLAGSTYLTLYAILLLVPAHVFFLKYFEETELTVRFGPGYTEYKRQVPFLIPHWRHSS